MVVNGKDVFLHLPKTGGISIRTIMLQSGGSKIDIDGDTHHGLEVAAKYFGDNWGTYNYMTHIRNPWAYYVSLYFHHKNQEQVATHEWVFFEGHKGIHHFIKRAALCNEFPINRNYIANKSQNPDMTSTSTLYRNLPVSDWGWNVGWLTFRLLYTTVLDWKSLFDFDLSVDLEMQSGPVAIKRMEDHKFSIHANKGTHLDYQEYYTDELRELVAQRDRLIINEFKYEY